MQEKLKDKRVLISVGVVLLLLIGGFFFMSQSKKQSSDMAQTSEDSIPTISPDKVGLKIASGSDATCLVNKTNNQLKLTLDKATDFKHVNAVFSYDADVPPSDQVEGGSGKVTQSFEVEKDISDGKVDSGFKLMGTCSKNVCRCDTGVESGKVVLKLTKSDGKVYQSEKTFKVPAE